MNTTLVIARRELANWTAFVAKQFRQRHAPHRPTGISHINVALGIRCARHWRATAQEIALILSAKK